MKRRDQRIGVTGTAGTSQFGKQWHTRNRLQWPDIPSASTSDILVLKLISVLVFILFSSQNFYFVLVFWINDNSSFYSFFV